jgi:hypothetical protein
VCTLLWVIKIEAADFAIFLNIANLLFDERMLVAKTHKAIIEYVKFISKTSENYCWDGWASAERRRGFTALKALYIFTYCALFKSGSLF